MKVKMALLTYFNLYIMVINLLSYNPTGILQESKRAFISDLLAENKVDIAFLQETWLLKSNTMLITEISEDYFFNSISGVDCQRDILQGRPYGGGICIMVQVIDTEHLNCQY